MSKKKQKRPEPDNSSLPVEERIRRIRERREKANRIGRKPQR